MLRTGLRAGAWAEGDKSPGGLELKCCGTLCCQNMVGAGMTMKGWEASPSRQWGRKGAAGEAVCAAGG